MVTTGGFQLAVGCGLWAGWGRGTADSGRLIPLTANPLCRPQSRDVRMGPPAAPPPALYPGHRGLGCSGPSPDGSPEPHSPTPRQLLLNPAEESPPC